MKVTTINPVYINKVEVGPKSRFLSFDGSSSSDVKAFQSWYNTKGYSPKLVVDGKFGPMSKAAYSTYGSDYEKSFSPIAPASNNPSSSNNSLSTTDNKGNKKDGQLFDKAKGIWVKAKDSGLVDSAKNWLNQKLGGDSSSTAPTTVDPTLPTTPDAPKKGMSKALKITLIVGGAALGLYILYRVSKRKSK